MEDFILKHLTKHTVHWIGLILCKIPMLYTKHIVQHLSFYVHTKVLSVGNAGYKIFW